MIPNTGMNANNDSPPVHFFATVKLNNGNILAV